LPGAAVVRSNPWSLGTITDVQLRHTLEKSTHRFAVERFSVLGALARSVESFGQVPDSPYLRLTECIDIRCKRHDRLVEMSAANASLLSADWALPNDDRHNSLYVIRRWLQTRNALRKFRNDDVSLRNYALSDV
jgi:hypothetical protein